MEPIIIKREKKKVIERQVSTTTSITCGRENPATLGCVFYELEGGEVATQFTVGRWHEGHEGIMHGGLSAAVLDEIMGRANGIYDKHSGGENNTIVTAEMTVSYLQPVPVGGVMTAYGRIEKAEGRKRWGTAELLDEKGMVMAKARGLYISVNINDGNYDERVQLGAADPTEL